ncbi:AAA family ATPase [Candidatus Nomurabacteria bacterium]|nr:AAA family ATPase [Candidatus Nomurabacteria bacterium]
MNQLSLHQPHAIIMVGIPGSGKTFFASKFSETFGAPHLDLQAISKYAASPEAAGQLAYMYLTELLKTRQSLVLELSTETRANRTEVARVVRDAGYAPLFVWTQVDQATAKSRTRKSKLLSPDEFDALVKRFSPPHEREHAVVISGKHTYASQAKIVLKHLTARRSEMAKDSSGARRGRINVQ